MRAGRARCVLLLASAFPAVLVPISIRALRPARGMAGCRRSLRRTSKAGHWFEDYKCAGSEVALAIPFEPITCKRRYLCSTSGLSMCNVQS